MSGRNCCNCIMLRLVNLLLDNLDSVIDKYQTGVMSEHVLLTDKCQWLNANCVRRRFVTTSFFLLDGCSYSQSFCGFFGLVTANIFSLVNEHNCFEWLLRGVSLLLLGSWSLRFLSTNSSQGSVATRLRCGGMFNYCFATDLLLSLSVKKIANRLPFGKDRGKSRVASFFQTWCSAPLWSLV